uniref:Uncharacterized protein n=1 Tax=Chromera velia CCMP2878 TaxID=1169474 RepID=A0A0G4GU25_9ALVE|eukprot:Cvel_762.t1-p1 / transcript=Cvel_762.t1 / gene=Cvel_762 / organism=Chromera_velia_CCMP2878 / gene_product=hypothetical protein / transcript_product=hypothetical protein / location=Cvel_scaffold23:145318-151367(+) / protein_length=148 / sequence_SO=supercontig / SO=protein_coding / is_pseudo=false
MSPGRGFGSGGRGRTQSPSFGRSPQPRYGGSPACKAGSKRIAGVRMIRNRSKNDDVMVEGDQAAKQAIKRGAVCHIVRLETAYRPVCDLECSTYATETFKGKSVDGILSMVDHLSKTPFFATVSSEITAEETAEVVYERVVYEHGMPQ